MATFGEKSKSRTCRGREQTCMTQNFSPTAQTVNPGTGLVWRRTRRLHPCGQELIGGHAQVLARRGSSSGSPNLEDRELDLIVERLVADHRKFPVVQEEPVVRDVESRARSE